MSIASRCLTALVLAVPLAGLAAGCIRVKSDPIEVKPIEITVNVNLKVQKELDSFFGDLDAQSKTVKAEKKDGAATP